MNNFFSNNLPWKIASLALATVLWIFVVNTQNPMQPEAIKNVSINIRGTGQLEEKGYVIQNEEKLINQKVTVQVKGPRLQIDELFRNKGLIDIRLDLAQNVKDLTGESDTVQIQGFYKGYIPIEGVTIVDITPKFADVIFEKEERITLPIEYNIDAHADNEYIALEPIIKPGQIELRGPKSYIEKISRVYVDINVNKFSEKVLSEKLPINVIDKEGNEVTGIKKSLQFAQVTLPIGKKKKVPIEAEFTGTLPEGYIQTNTIINPKEITIVGKSELVDSIQTIKLTKIQLNNLIQSTTLKAQFILPKGVEYIDKIEDKATVTIEIKKQNSHLYKINMDNLNLTVNHLSPNLRYEIMDKEFELLLSATAEELLAFNANNLTATLDLKDLEAGEYAMPIQVDIPNNYKIMNTPLTINVRIVSKNEENTTSEGTLVPKETAGAEESTNNQTTNP